MKPEILAQMKLVAESGIDAPPGVTLELVAEVERLGGLIELAARRAGIEAELKKRGASA